jgi:FlaA1/EpsC-like NDP-sugar epimerase
MTFLTDKTILVTGGTGSMGQVFVRRALAGEHGRPRQVIVFSRDEAKQYEMRRKQPNARYILGDIRNYADVEAAMEGVDIVVNAAALKQVPSCEYFPEQAILTNCIGAQNIVRAARYHLPSYVVSVSTDKACKPTTAMGMSKALQERIMIAANVDNKHTWFIGVRYGNVLVSRGSMIPLFQEQIQAGGPVTVTVPEMTRFLLSIDQAVDTTLEAIRTARPGEIYVPKAPSATIMHIALEMCSGRDITIKVTGIRPNEKMDEIMVSEEEAVHTADSGNYYVVRPTLPELGTYLGGVGLVGEYSSRDHVLTPYDLRALLKQHGIIQEAA